MKELVIASPLRDSMYGRLFRIKMPEKYKVCNYPEDFPQEVVAELFSSVEIPSTNNSRYDEVKTILFKIAPEIKGGKWDSTVEAPRIDRVWAYLNGDLDRLEPGRQAQVRRVRTTNGDNDINIPIQVRTDATGYCSFRSSVTYQGDYTINIEELYDSIRERTEYLSETPDERTLSNLRDYAIEEALEGAQSLYDDGEMREVDEDVDEHYSYEREDESVEDANLAYGGEEVAYTIIERVMALHTERMEAADDDDA